jgi:pseudouridine-5'-phosphate glycosidase
VPSSAQQVVRLSPEVEAAIRGRQPVVALESSVLAQGLPIPANREAARRMSAAAASRGAVTAISAVVRGRPAFGLTPDELERFLARDGVRKVSARDLAGAMLAGADGATTVAASLALCALAGLRVFATGGIGGVHREPPYDESADLVELARTPVVVVCAGAKTILDLEATMERLETLGVTVAGYRTDEMPGFFTVRTGIALSLRLDTPADVARLFAANRRLGRPGAVLVMQQPPPDSALTRDEVEAAVRRASDEARRRGLRGAAVTPFLLGEVERSTGGRSLAANLALLEQNVALAAEIARADIDLRAGDGEAV